MSYLLDTNACIALVGGRPTAVRERFDRTIRAGDEVSVPSIAVFELWHGVEKSAKRPANAERLTIFLRNRVQLLPFDEADAKAAGALRADLEAAGTPIGGYDYLIAAMALRRNLTLITANVREFSRVRNLTWQDWSRD